MSHAPARFLTLLAALDGFAAVAGGAFGAHGVQDEAARTQLHTAAEYQLAAGAFGLGMLALAQVRTARAAAGLVLVGGLLFGASLDGIVLSGVRALGAITPLGGLMMLAGFATLGFGALTVGAPALSDPGARGGDAS